MKRRRLLGALGTVPVAAAGCVASPANSSEQDDTSSKTNGTDEKTVVEPVATGVTGPGCAKKSKTVEIERSGDAEVFETAETVPYPDRPTTFARDEILAYVRTFEEAYVRKDVLCGRDGPGHVFGISYSVLERETFDRDDDIVVVFLLRIGAATSGSDGTGTGTLWQSDVAPGGVVYAVDESGVARASFPEADRRNRDEFESNAPDPLESGTLVAAFD